MVLFEKIWIEVTVRNRIEVNVRKRIEVTVRYWIEVKVRKWIDVRCVFRRIKECGKDAYCRCSRGIANYNNWNKIYDEFISSGSNMNRYYLNNLIGKVDYSRKTFYRQMKRIEKERELMVDLEHKCQNVNVVTLQQHEVDDLTQNSPKKITSTSQVKLVTVKVNLANNTSINFDSPNPEFSVAKIIAALGRM